MWEDTPLFGGGLLPSEKFFGKFSKMRGSANNFFCCLDGIGERAVYIVLYKEKLKRNIENMSVQCKESWSSEQNTACAQSYRSVQRDSVSVERTVGCTKLQNRTPTLCTRFSQPRRKTHV